MFNGNIRPMLLYKICLRNLGDLEIDLCRSHKAKSDGAVGLLIYDFLSVFKSKMWPNAPLLLDIRLRHLSDLKYDLSLSVKGRCDGAIAIPCSCGLT